MAFAVYFQLVCIWIHGCFNLRGFSRFSNLIVFVFIFFLRWSTWAWINSSLSTWQDFINFLEKMGILEHKRFQWAVYEFLKQLSAKKIMNKVSEYVNTVPKSKIEKENDDEFIKHELFKKLRSTRNVVGKSEKKLKPRSTKHCKQFSNRCLCVRFFVFMIRMATREFIFQTMIAKLWTLNVRAPCPIRTDRRILVLHLKVKRFSISSSVLSWKSLSWRMSPN